MAQRVWLITGVRSAFGRHLTAQLLARGDRVVGTVRKTDTVADLAAAYPDLFRVEVLDVRDTSALRAVVKRTVDDLGRIDVVISNAGYGVFGAAEELTDDQIEAITATNLTASINSFVPRCRTCGRPAVDG
jgi:NAD(P)-dependent dehydrogenase (short-subunit alcohol dehydrogenase family)